jgi:hypothetical protein
MEHITTNILIDPKNFERFKIINIKRKEKTGEAIGRLISADVLQNSNLLMVE